ncbi:helix-turn-helix domain-containing protein [Arthrobacter sp. S2(2024)]|uniref:helix-turn-helix domain-containing protein n=1 Tax=Arthrobacter sp. S2(2024) TaxID=3111911 RepID=UPI002FC8A031
MATSLSDVGRPNPRDQLGPNLRAIRRARSLTLREVAQRSRISEGWLSQIERGRSVPSIDILYRVASALDIAVHDLFQGPEQQQMAPLLEVDRPRIEWGEGGAYKTLITMRPDSAIDVFIGHFPPGASTGAAYTHGDSSEVLLVMRGTVTTTVGGLTHVMHEGSSLEYRSSMPHFLTNKSTDNATVLWAVSPPTSGT